MAQIEDLVEKISTLSVLEVSELVKALEEKLGVSAAVPMAAAPAAGAAPVAEEGEQAKDSFEVVLVEAGAKKIDVIKEVRALTALGLKEAKDLVEAGNKSVKENVPKAEAEEIKKKFEEIGAKVELR